MKPTSASEVRSKGHELASSITHGVATVLSIVGLSVLVVFASLRGTAWHVVSCSIYGATLVLLFLASTLYHSFRSPRVKHVFHIIDHCSIYLLIAGSYTPFMLVTIRGGWGWSLFGSVWGLAIAGIMLKAFFTGRFRVVSTLVYVLMGWLIVIAIKPLWNAIPQAGFYWLLAGGLFYTLGIIFYVWKKIPYNHAIWHLFVLAGAMSHYFAIMFFVVPWPS